MITINNLVIIDPQNFTTTTGANNDVPLDSSILNVTCTSDNDSITGLTIPMAINGALLWVVNVSATNTLIIENDNAGSTSGYRFILGGGSTTLTLEAGQGQQFIFTSGTGWAPLRVGTFA